MTVHDDVRVVTDPGRACPVCGGEILATMTLSRGWINGAGRRVRGHADVPLCAHCDRDAPAAAAIVTFFAVHGRVTTETVGEFAVLVDGWADHVTARRLDTVALDAEAEAWRNGDL